MKVDNGLINKTDLISLYSSVSKIRNAFHGQSNNNILLNMDDDHFILTTILLNPQSYGFKIENRIRNIFNLSKSDADEGDGLSIAGKRVEIKSSLITDSNKTLNIVQIRKWQNIDCYILYCCDIRNSSDIKHHYFLLSKNDMDFELSNNKVSSAHGTRKCNFKNKNIELAIRIPVDSLKFKKFLLKYGKSIQEIKNILSN